MYFLLLLICCVVFCVCLTIGSRTSEAHNKRTKKINLFLFIFFLLFLTNRKKLAPTSKSSTSNFPQCFFVLLATACYNAVRLLFQTLTLCSLCLFSTTSSLSRVCLWKTVEYFLIFFSLKYFKSYKNSSWLIYATKYFHKITIKS